MVRLPSTTCLLLSSMRRQCPALAWALGGSRDAQPGWGRHKAVCIPEAQIDTDVWALREPRAAIR
jgi:hypothetical protein